MHLDPGEVFDTSYTYRVVAKTWALRHSDIWNLKDRKQYQVTLREQSWWWRFEDDLPADCSHEQRREILIKLRVAKWKPDCSTWFEYRKNRSEVDSQRPEADAPDTATKPSIDA